jgi:hypothetical protein
LVLTVLYQPPGSSVVATTDSVKVKLADEAGNAVRDSVVTFTAQTGGSSVGVAQVVTDANGVAATTWTFGTIVAANGLSVWAPGLENITWISVTPMPAALAAVHFQSKIVTLAGATVALPLIGNDTYGNVRSIDASVTTCRTSAPSVATVDVTSLRVTKVGSGQSIITCGTSAAPPDSMIVASVPANGVWIGTATGVFDVASNTMFETPVVIDASAHQSNSLGSMTYTVSWDTAQLTYVRGFSWMGSPPVLNTTDVANGRLTVSVASAFGVISVSPATVLYLDFQTAAAPGRTGTITVSVSQAADVTTFADALPTIVGLSQPLVLK